MPQYLFAYGTLRLNAQHKMAKKLASAASLVSLGYITNAQLYKIDWYPALVQSDEEDQIVVGDIFHLEDENLLIELDEYEGVGIGTPPYEYRRELIKAYTDGKEIECWVYWYNIPLPNNAQIIDSGDFLNP